MKKILVFIFLILFFTGFTVAAGTCSGTPAKCDYKTSNSCNNHCECTWIASCTADCSGCGTESDCGTASGCTWTSESGGTNGTASTTIIIPGGGGIQNVIGIFPRTPLAGEVLYSENTQLKVEIFFGGALNNGAIVKANSSMFGEVVLKHDSGLPDGVYTANVTIKDTEYGTKKITYTAEKAGQYNEAYILVELKPSLEIITDINSKYPKDSLIKFNGTILDKFQQPENNSFVKISGYQNGNKIFYLETFTNKDGNFYSDYLIKHGDPEGIWNISIEAESEKKELGLKYLSTQITVPKGVSYYSVNFLSPLQEKTFRRGEVVPLTVEVKDVNKPVSGASVIVYAPSGDNVILKEAEEGKYSGVYLVKPNDQIDNWFLKAEVEKKVGEFTRVGGANMFITVGPTEFNFNVLSPVSDTVYTNSRIKIKIKLTYPDNSLVKGADLNALLLNKNEEIPLQEVSDGIYEGSYFAGTEDIGTLILKIDAKDVNENFGTLNKEVFIRKGSFIGNIFSLIFDAAKQYWWLILTVLIVIALIYQFKIEMLWIKREIKKSLDEQEKIKTMQIDTEKKYYNEGAITKKEFRDIMGKYEERASKAKEDEKVYKKRLTEASKKQKRMNETRDNLLSKLKLKSH
jgi:hypothetical protein